MTPLMPDCARQICMEVAQAHNIPFQSLFIKTREQRISHARWAVFYKLNVERGWSLPRVAKIWGYDHTTVLWGVRQYKRMYLKPTPAPIHAPEVYA